MAPFTPPLSPWLEQTLPGLATAFDETAMQALLQSALCGPAPDRLTIERCALDQATYSPDIGCALRYKVTLRDAEHGATCSALVCGDIYAGEAARRAAYQALEALAVEHAHATSRQVPGLRPLTQIPSLDMIVRVFPLDASMPTLLPATDNSTMLEVLRQAVPAARDRKLVLDECRAELVDYGRVDRCTLRYRLAAHTDAGEPRSLIVYGKVTGDGSGALAAPVSAGLREHIARSGGDPVRVPETFAWLPELKLALLEAIPGEPRVGDALKARIKGAAEPAERFALEGLLDRAAHVAGLLHTSGLALGPRRTLEDELSRLERRVDGIEPAAPELGAQLRQRIRQLAPYALGALTLVLSHGDYNSNQLLFDGAATGLIDFDSICQAEPALDLAQLLVYLQLGATKYLTADGSGERIMGAVTDRVLRSYGSTTGLGRRETEQLAERIRIYRMVTLIRRALQSWYKFKAKRVDQALDLLDAAAGELPDPGRPAAIPATPKTLDLATPLHTLATLPPWLRAALDQEQLRVALSHAIPELARGTLKLASCKVKRLVLNETGERWVGTYTLGLEDPVSGQRQSLVLRGSLTPPRLRDAAAVPAGASALGASDWRCTLPELGLTLTPEPPDVNLASVPQLVEAEAARALLEQALATHGPAPGGTWLAGCTPEVLSHKPGSRAVIRYRLQFTTAPDGSGPWPAEVIGKTYRKLSKAENAFSGMQALWLSPLASSPGIRIAEPLALIPEHKLMLQTALPADQTLEELLNAALHAGSALTEEVVQATRRAAAALAALHHSSVAHPTTASLDARIAELPRLLARLTVAEPDLGPLVQPLISWLQAEAARTPADPPVPTHGTFAPEQVLLIGTSVGLIDFDNFCMAEPALDVGLYCAAIKDTGMNVGDGALERGAAARDVRLRELEVLCDVFVDAYLEHAPVSRRRVLLWQALDALRSCLHYRVKAKPAEPDTPMLVLRQLQRQLA